MNAIEYEFECELITARALDKETKDRLRRMFAKASRQMALKYKGAKR